MKYRIRINVEIATEQGCYHSPLRLEESSEIELDTLSDAARILVHLHELFEEVKQKSGKVV